MTILTLDGTKRHSNVIQGAIGAAVAPEFSAQDVETVTVDNCRTPTYKIKKLRSS
jgi:hypothetical protein